MSDATPTIGDPKDIFTLPSRAEDDLGALIEQADFDAVHFFITEALTGDLIPDEPGDDDVELALIPYDHDSQAIDADTFRLVDDAGYSPATLRDLLNLAISRPQLQREYDIVALGTLRTRQVFEDKPGQTIWNSQELDKSICQWATGLSNLKAQRTLVPVEIFLDEVLHKDTLLLVRK